MWEGRGSVEAQDSSKRKMSLGVWGGGRSVCGRHGEVCVWSVGGWLGGVCV